MDGTGTRTPNVVAGLPPGPKVPMAVQTVLFMSSARAPFLTRCWRRYGDVFTLRMLGRSPMVVLCDGEHTKPVFAGRPEVFHAGEGNEILRPVLGEHSLLTMDEDAHRQARRMLMPAFNGAALHRYARMISQIAAEQVPQWPTGRVQALHPWLQKLTLEVILRVVFGVTGHERLARMRRLVPRVTGIGSLTFLASLVPWLHAVPSVRSSWRHVAELDRLLLAEIAERRHVDDIAERSDVLSMMLRAGAGPQPPSDQELRDELITLVLAGHETTATGLAWTFHELARNPGVLRAATTAAEDGDEDYLEAVFKEALRLRPVVYGVSRKLTEPTEIAGYRLPRGAIVSPSIGLPHQDSRRFEHPERFDPDRFCGGQPASTDWLPFGGGVRRCIGAGFSIAEAVQILRVALATMHVRPGRRAPERARARTVTLIPHRGARVLLTPRQ